jgi:hypothetical protein
VIVSDPVSRIMLPLAPHSDPAHVRLAIRAMIAALPQMRPCSRPGMPTMGAVLASASSPWMEFN